MTEADRVRKAIEDYAEGRITTQAFLDLLRESRDETNERDIVDLTEAELQSSRTAAAVRRLGRL